MEADDSSLGPTENRNKQLLAAVQRCDVKAVKTALLNGADAGYNYRQEKWNARTEISVLYIACSSRCEYNGTYCGTIRLRAPDVGAANREEIVKLLLASGADPNDGLGWSMAVGQAWDTCLIASFPSIEVATILLEKGANPNGPQGWREDCNNETYPLDVAADNDKLVELLIRYGSNRRSRYAPKPQRIRKPRRLR